MVINESRDVLLVVLGWLLGLLGPAIVSAIRDRREAKRVREALLKELRELQFRIVLIIYLTESKYGKLDHSFFKWAESILTGYAGVNSADSLLKTIGPLLNLTDKEMSDFAQHARQRHRPNTGLALKKISLPLLEVSLPSLTRFDSVLRGRLLEIKTHIGFINETVDDARYYFRLSFQNDISSENYQRANANMIDSYKTYASQARVVAETIGKILVAE